MILGDAARKEMIAWLEQDIVSNDAIAKHFEKFAMPTMAKEKRLLVMAEQRVLRELTNCEVMTIESENPRGPDGV